jgi:mono/diheme cytochrome c family protein
MKMQRKILIGLVLTLIIVIFIPLYWATESGRQGAARQRIKTEAVERGAHLYPLHCAKCHGREGEGKIGPALKGTTLDEGLLRRTIARGIPGKPMPAFGEEYDGALKNHQIEDLVVFIKNWDQSLIASSPHEAPGPEPASALAHGGAPGPAGTPSGPSAGTPATSFGEIKFDPNTPQKTLRSGERIFRASCNNADCHELPTADDIKDLESDEELIETLTKMVERAKLPAVSAEEVMRYLLSVRHGVVLQSSHEEQSNEPAQRQSAKGL